VPFPVAILFDALAVQRLFATLGREVPLMGQARARIAAEAVHLSLPGGAVLADGANAVWLAAFGVPMAEAATVTGERRCLVMQAHAVYIVLAGAAGFATLAKVSQALFGTGVLAWGVLAGAAAPLALSCAIRGAFRNRAGARVHGLLASSAACLPARVARHALAWLDARSAAFSDADGAALRLARVPLGATVTAIALFFAGWMCESVESFVVVRLAHAPASVGFVDVMAFEAAVSLVRAAAPFAPAGLGLVDVGYVAVLRVLGVEDADVVAPAFVLLKRAKELVWVLIGYAAALVRTTPARTRSFVGTGSGLHLPPPA
jgi:hypothetical protein